MKASEKRIGKLPYKNGYAFSTPVKQAAFAVIETRKKMRYDNVTNEPNTRDNTNLDLELKQNKHTLKTLQAKADKLRDTD